MFQSLDGKRRSSDSLSSASSATRRRLGNNKNASPSTNNINKNAVASILSGLLICLTGLVAEEKTRLHEMVEQLGGKFARNLDTARTTHLIAQTPHGAKYETAAACPSISVVTPEWLTECFAAGKRLDEAEYTLVSPQVGAEGVRQQEPLGDALDQVLAERERSKLFYSFRFLLLGFEQDSKETNLLEKLIRRGQGTIFWELNETITHLLIQDGCDQVIIDAAESVSTHHPLGPSFASPHWALASWKARQLLSVSDFRPVKASVTITKKMVEARTNVGEVTVKKRASSLFRGSLFSLVRLSPPSEAVDFDSNDLSNAIVANGGQILSQKVVDALKADQRRQDSSRRICYVVFWGGYTPTHISIHTLLSQLQKQDLCKLVLVSVIWLKTAIADGKLPSPISRRPVLFQPRPWPLQLLSKELKLAVTGFVHSERTAVIQLIRAVGASYTENMKPSNTHLICHEAKGPKFEKAIEWRLYVVSIDWLYHVVQYGYSGQNGMVKTGCENEFSLRTDPTASDEEEDDFPQSQEIAETQFVP